VEVLFADLPELNGAMGKFVLITMANVAELEAGLISERTKAALKAAKARGMNLGRHGADVLAPQYHEEARQRAKELGDAEQGLFNAPYGDRAHQAQGENSARWNVACTDRKDGVAAPRRLISALAVSDQAGGRDVRWNECVS
jgi:hypothetical protein